MKPYSVWIHDPAFHALNAWACTAECDFERQARAIAAQEGQYCPRAWVEIYKIVGPGRYQLVGARRPTSPGHYPEPATAALGPLNV